MAIILQNSTNIWFDFQTIYKKLVSFSEWQSHFFSKLHCVIDRSSITPEWRDWHGLGVSIEKKTSILTTREICVLVCLINLFHSFSLFSLLKEKDTPYPCPSCHSDVLKRVSLFSGCFGFFSNCHSGFFGKFLGDSQKVL